jgi:hypothetical protein
MSENMDNKPNDDGLGDHLLRRTLQGYRVEPRSGLWKGISRKLIWSDLIHFNFANLSPMQWLAGSAGVLMVATALYFSLSDGSDDPMTLSVGPSVQTTVRPVSDVNAALQHERTTDQPPEQVVTDNTLSAPVPERNYFTANQVAAPGKQTLSVQVVPETGTPAFPNPEVNLKSEVVKVPGITRLIPLAAGLSPEMPGRDTIITVVNPSGIYKFRKEKPGAGQFFSASLGVTPEISIYSEPEDYSKTNFWLDGLITWHISRFSMATGFSLGYMFDEGNYRVEYKSFDSIGFYTGVTSYLVGSGNELTYNTYTVTVYDSILHLGDQRTKNRYSYIQIPLLLGYRVFEAGRISLSFQAGPAFSILTGSRKSDPVIEYANARIIRIDDDTPSRLKTNWQVWANILLEMRMTRQISLYLQPSFKYSLKPLAEHENTPYKAPLTIGLGIGLQFNFGQKQTRP